MNQTITIELPEETMRRYRRGASAARKDLEHFVVERLNENAPPTADDLPQPLSKEFQAMEAKNDKALLKIAESRMPIAHQRRYNRLLSANSQGRISPGEQAKLHVLGEQARRLTLRKAHAYLLLKWRGHSVPSLD
jgi:hypothetical protein